MESVKKKKVKLIDKESRKVGHQGQWGGGDRDRLVNGSNF